MEHEKSRSCKISLRRVGLQDICVFDPFLSRGLSFYTGTVYEIFDASQGFRSSLGGGGRYDAIIGRLVGREDIVYPTVGLSFGMESIMEMIRNRPIETNKPLVVVIPIGETIPEGLTGSGTPELRDSYAIGGQPPQIEENISFCFS